MFVRSKKIKGNQYYYVCESTRKDGKVEQRVRAYLGSYRNAKQQIGVNIAKLSRGARCIKNSYYI